jgi:hypothetical protein
LSLTYFTQYDDFHFQPFSCKWHNFVFLHGWIIHTYTHTRTRTHTHAHTHTCWNVEKHWKNSNVATSNKRAREKLLQSKLSSPHDLPTKTSSILLPSHLT